MTKIRKMVVAGALTALAAAGKAQAADCSAWFMVERDADAARIHAYCSCPEPGPVEYRIETTTGTPAGTSSDAASGSHELGSGTPAKLATVTVKGEPGGYYDVLLEVFREGKRVARAREAGGSRTQ
ncbi:curli-like amyloid fiber formation chaperone CsgH [Geobacter sp. DSM 9736]|uniref:curli-like amyloid fiber formation chaperone CsgH n=1 Tax=Geobacter sp. DSM 9736 TaxID=1277350 RepID=UPI000B4FDABD|nr:curli-like amyloid fiber formation chaperone CsgH [Geobacter sp. DSM 9736]SNB46312.1 hypothetical protein SAMN06269301_1761 [Geobacter sp. DSM 9736]